MNDDQFDDLKQFIDSRISQSEALLTQKIDGVEERVDGLEKKVSGLEKKVDGLEQKIDDGFAGVGEAIEQVHKQLELRDAEVDQRIITLEQAAA
jgi:predicted  nucleic acid-binding Zn-ribbon protein